MIEIVVVVVDGEFFKEVFYEIFCFIVIDI